MTDIMGGVDSATPGSCRDKMVPDLLDSSLAPAAVGSFALVLISSLRPLNLQHTEFSTY
jgi:hypothetical protein